MPSRVCRLASKAMHGIIMILKGSSGKSAIRQSIGQELLDMQLNHQVCCQATFRGHGSCDQVTDSVTRKALVSEVIFPLDLTRRKRTECWPRSPTSRLPRRPGRWSRWRATCRCCTCSRWRTACSRRCPVGRRCTGRAASD